MHYDSFKRNVAEACNPFKEAFVEVYRACTAGIYALWNNFSATHVIQVVFLIAMIAYFPTFAQEVVKLFTKAYKPN